MAPVAAIGRAACPLPAAVIAFVITAKLPFRFRPRAAVK